MIRTRIIACFFNLYSMSAVAGYECVLQLSHTENLDKVIAEKTVHIGNHQMRAGSEGILFVEYQKGKKKTTLDINSVMSGWEDEEDATFAVIRWTSNRRNVRGEAVSEKFTLKGDDELTGWFDSYKLDISCQVKKRRGPL